MSKLQEQLALHGLTKENLLRSLPISLSDDPKMVALADAIAGLLAQRREEINRISIYPHIDRLDEPLLDILARDFKVDWWDSDYALEEKRRTMLTSWQVHKTLGTKAAVETALRAIFPHTNVEEWFEYGGKPYWFRLVIEIPDDDWTLAKHKSLMWRLQFFKNLRSHNEKVMYKFAPVVLENHQEFCFVAMLTAMRIREPGADAGQLLHQLTIWLHQRQPPGGLPWTVRMGAGAANRNGSSLFRVAFRAWVSFFGWDTVFFNGHRRFDGTFTFDQRLEGPFRFEHFQVRVHGCNRQHQRLTGGTSGAAAKAKTYSRLSFADLKIHAYVSLFAQDAVLFRGYRRLDGSYNFDQKLRRTFRFQHIRLRCRSDNVRSGQPQRFIFRAISANAQSAAAYLSPDPNARQTL